MPRVSRRGFSTENAAGTLEHLHFRLTDRVARTASAPPQHQRLCVCFVSERQLGGRNWLLKTSAAACSANYSFSVLNRNECD